jgi:hypothetical protein
MVAMVALAMVAVTIKVEVGEDLGQVVVVPAVEGEADFLLHQVPPQAVSD